MSQVKPKSFLERFEAMLAKRKQAPPDPARRPAQGHSMPYDPLPVRPPECMGSHAPSQPGPFERMRALLNHLLQHGSAPVAVPKLATAMGTKHTAVRRAIRRLERDGFLITVRTEPGRPAGYHVTAQGRAWLDQPNAEQPARLRNAYRLLRCIAERNGETVRLASFAQALSVSRKRIFMLIRWLEQQCLVAVEREARSRPLTVHLTTAGREWLASWPTSLSRPATSMLHCIAEHDGQPLSLNQLAKTAGVTAQALGYRVAGLINKDMVTATPSTTGGCSSYHLTEAGRKWLADHPPLASAKEA